MQYVFSSGMHHPDQGCYHSRRALQERRMAKRARCVQARERHFELAVRHEAAVGLSSVD